MEDKEISNLLSNLNYGFCFKFNFLYCIKCEIILGTSFRRHAKKLHSKKILLTIVKRIELLLEQNACKINSLQYLKSPIDNEALVGIKVFSGFKCVSCFYCCVSKDTMRKHKCSNFEKFEVKNVQSFNYRRSSFY